MSTACDERINAEHKSSEARGSLKPVRLPVEYYKSGQSTEYDTAIGIDHHVVWMRQEQRRFCAVIGGQRDLLALFSDIATPQLVVGLQGHASFPISPLVAFDDVLLRIGDAPSHQEPLHAPIVGYAAPCRTCIGDGTERHHKTSG